MDPQKSAVCCGCLNTDRNMQTIEEYLTRKCFAQIINELPATHCNASSVLLCWQCAALLKKFTRFKHQILQSYQVLQEYGRTSFTTLKTKVTAQKLEVKRLKNITVLPDREEKRTEFYPDILKVNNLDSNAEIILDDLNVKEEFDAVSDGGRSDDDNTNLIEVAKKSRKKKVDAQNFTTLDTAITAKRIEVKRLNNLTILSSTEEHRTEPTGVLKLENLDTNSRILDNVKSEYGVLSNYDDGTDNDDAALIEVAKKNKNLLKRSVKKRKKKKDVAQTEVYTEVELSSAQIEEERRVLASKEEYVNAMFKCERCIMSFPNVDDLKDHVHLKHDLNASHFKCSICECSFASEVSHGYHVNKHTRRYQCVACCERFASKRAVLKHYDAVHCCGNDEVNIEKDIRPNGVLKNIDIANDGDTTRQEQSFPCELCDKSFRWKTSLRKHAETHRIEAGQKRKPYCEPCKITFTTTSNLQKHVKTSSKHQIQLKLRKLKESCSEAEGAAGAEGVGAEREGEAERQVRLAVNGERARHTCAVCGARYQWRGNLLRHLHTHAARAKGELVCEPCNRTFSSIATYQQHMKISKKHVSENDFKFMCSDCGKRFANKTRLKDHVDWEHLKNFVHTCQTCQKVFKSHTSLYLHKQVVHIKNNPEHLCDHCGKPFPNQAKLRSHITALHSGEAPYKCGSCAARFSWHSCLSRHVRRVHRKRLGS